MVCGTVVVRGREPAVLLNDMSCHMSVPDCPGAHGGTLYAPSVAVAVEGMRG